MKSAAHLNRMAYDPVHLLGELLRREDDGSYAVACDGRIWTVQRAASCLLEPQPGDEVLISGPDPARIYLIAVTVQADPARTTLQAEGELLLRSGSIRMVARQLHATVGEVRLVGRSYEAVMDRMTLMARLSQRSVSEMDQVRAGAIDFQAEQSARLHAAYTVVTGGDLVKVDAKQIHMG
ncbi:DUF3540 domain-containing protein [Achromobacter aegrifaciens]|uniref:DUF3540 domain-containing protein n=1 Tax=Achromobacter aegrifaciens TaxID=1287736 RepID=UPI00320B8F72